jgi:hypothetical protein
MAELGKELLAVFPRQTESAHACNANPPYCIEHDREKR